MISNVFGFPGAVFFHTSNGILTISLKITIKAYEILINYIIINLIFFLILDFIFQITITLSLIDLNESLRNLTR